MPALFPANRRDRATTGGLPLHGIQNTPPARRGRSPCLPYPRPPRKIGQPQGGAPTRYTKHPPRPVGAGPRACPTPGHPGRSGNHRGLPLRDIGNNPARPVGAGPRACPFPSQPGRSGNHRGLPLHPWMLATAPNSQQGPLTPRVDLCQNNHPKPYPTGEPIHHG